MVLDLGKPASQLVDGSQGAAEFTPSMSSSYWSMNIILVCVADC